MAEPVRTLDETEISEHTGRMYECWDIEQAIESGHLSSLDDVLAYVRSRSRKIAVLLGDNGVTDKSVSPERIEGVRALFEADELGLTKH